jgi:hypothetical protein
MIGKIIGAVVGAKAADHVRGVNEPGGALLGIGAAALARRLSLPAMLALAAGGYVYKRYTDKPQRKRARAKPRPSAT